MILLHLRAWAAGVWEEINKSLVKRKKNIRRSSSDRPGVWKWRRGKGFEVLFNFSLFSILTQLLETFSRHFVFCFLPVKLHTGVEDAAGKRQGPVSNKKKKERTRIGGIFLILCRYRNNPDSYFCRLLFVTLWISFQERMSEHVQHI